MSGPFEPSQPYIDQLLTEADEEEWDDLPSPDGSSMYHGDQAPPYANSPAVGQVIHAGVQYGMQNVQAAQATYQRQPFPHSVSSPQILQPPPISPPLPASPPPPRARMHSRRRSGLMGAGELHRYSQGQNEQSLPGLGLAMQSSTSTLGKRPGDITVSTHYVLNGQNHDPTFGAPSRSSHRPPPRQPSNLHPYVMTFTSPIGEPVAIVVAVRLSSHPNV